MPVDPVTSAIVGTLIGAAVQGLMAPAPAPPVTGIVRHLPQEAARGMMQPPAYGQVRIDGRTFLLSPAVVIRNEINLAIPSAMVQAPVPVRFQTDTMGAVFRVWILSAAELGLAENR
ncbi:MAG: hypothetical protein KGZ43_02610 [Sulfuritalea sp.]|nr:hypothetical protein [Sulfuritalea sp.]